MRKVKVLVSGLAAFLLLSGSSCPNIGASNDPRNADNVQPVPTEEIVVVGRESTVGGGFATLEWPYENDRLETVDDIWRMYSNGTGQRKVTDTPGVDEEFPVLSPDGTRIAYAANDDIFVLNLDGSGRVDVTGNGGFDRPELYPEWTPSGNVVFAGSKNNNYDIWTVQPDGSNINRILDDPGDQLAPDVSPDGSKVAVMTRTDENGQIFWDIAVGTTDAAGDAVVYDRCPRNVEDCSDGFPRWSPDGTKLAFSSWREEDAFDSGEAYVMDAQPNATPVQEAKLLEDRVSWSADGQRLVFVETNGSSGDLNWAQIGGNTTALTSCSCYDGFGADAGLMRPLVTIRDTAVKEGDSGTSTNKLVFEVQLSGPSENPVSVSYATTPKQATAGSDYQSVNGVLTIPAGQTRGEIQVTVIGDTTLETDERLYLELSNPQGAALGRKKAYGKIVEDDKPVPTPSPTPSVSPTPTPTATPTGAGAIAYQSNLDEVWLINPDGSDKHKLTDGTAPDWKWDGSQVAFSTLDDIYQVPPTGGTPTKMNGTTNFDGSPSWAPDGSGISWTTLVTSGPDVYKAEPPTGTPQAVAATSAAEFNQDWAIRYDGTEVIAMEKDDAIVFVDPDTGAQIGSAIVQGNDPGNPAISPDGTKLAYNSTLHGDPDIFVQDLTSLSTPAAHLTTSSAEDLAPTWSPDGSMLAFSSNRTGNFEIFTMPATGGTQINITNSSGDDVEPAWGPAGTATSRLGLPGGSDLEPPPKPSPEPTPSPSGTSEALIGVPFLLLGSALLTRRRSRSR